MQSAQDGRLNLTRPQMLAANHVPAWRREIWASLFVLMALGWAGGRPVHLTGAASWAGGRANNEPKLAAALTAGELNGFG